jgi:hypothetical protein
MPALEALEPRLLLSGSTDPLTGALEGSLPGSALVEVQAGTDAGSPEVGAGAIELISPEQGVPALIGEPYPVRWSGGYAGATLQIWACGPDGWSKIGTDVDAAAGQYDWGTTGIPQGWYCFSAWVRHADGEWIQTASPRWVRMSHADNHAPQLEYLNFDPHPECLAGQPFTFEWNAIDADGDNVSVTLWAYSDAAGWNQIAYRLNGSLGGFTWDTSAEWIAPGWYCFSAWLFDGAVWAASPSPRWLRLSAEPEDVTVEVVDPDSQGGRTVRIRGTGQDDELDIERTGDGLVVSWLLDSRTITGDVDRIEIDTYGGRDVVRIASGVSAAVTVRAGAGDDSVYAAGSSADTLEGGDGDDLLVAIGGGSDVVVGGAGLDSVWIDAGDTLTDLSADEAAAAALHTVEEFYQPYTSDPQGENYVPLDIAGQDLLDPTLTSANYTYADFSSSPLFVGPPTLEDVNQGSVGDCYFLAALGGLTLADPQVIVQMVTELGDGTYAVRFHDDFGQEVYLRVDGELPVLSSNPSYLAYAKQGAEGQVWVPVVEKAFAYMRTGENSYASLHGGWMAEVFDRVAAADSTTDYLPGMAEADVWQLFAEHIDAGHAVTLGSYSGAASPIVGNHAYAVYSVSSTGDDLFVTVFNPWGVDGRSWDSDYNDGMLTVSMAQVLDNFPYACVCLA